MPAIDTRASEVASAKGHLLRLFGMAFALAVAVGTTIGGGILRTPGEIAAYLPDTAWYIGIWLFGGVSILLGATVYAELGAMLPTAGGSYVFVRRAFGDYAGFVVGLVDWLTRCTSTAALGILIGEYSAAFVPAFLGHAGLVACGVIGVLALLHWHSVRWGGQIQTLSTVAKLVALVGLALAALWLPHPAVARVPLLMPHGLTLLAALALAMQGVIYTFNGYQAPIFFGEDLHDPGYQIPRSIFRGVFLIIAVYLLLNAAFLWMLPVSRMAGDSFVAGTVAGMLFGKAGSSVIRAIVLISILGVMNSTVLVTARVLMSLGRDRLFFSPVTRVGRGGTPGVALLLSTALAFALALSGTFAVVIGMFAVLQVIIYLSMFASLVALRRHEPDLARPYRAWGYPWTTALAALIGVAFLTVVAFTDARNSVITLVILLLSWPLYRGMVMLRRKQA